MVSSHLQQVIHIPVGSVQLEGELIIPQQAKGVVLFAHGSGSSRFSPRNQFVAQSLRDHQLATLLIDLLTAEEEEIDLQTRALRFDIDLLAERLSSVTDWLLQNSKTTSLSIGYFGSSTGAAAALIAAAIKGPIISAVVSRGGRPDLASFYLSRVRSPTLLIVGSEDTTVIELNERAYKDLSCEKEFKIIPEATHLFEEPGALEQVADLAGLWFLKYLASKIENGL